MKALCLVDVQRDFFPGGALPAPYGEKILPIIEALLEMDWDLVVASKDWHPPNHKSFASVHERNVGDIITLHGRDQILWPDHCVQNSEGAEFMPGFKYSRIDKTVYKGTDPNIDSYSAFYDDGHRRSTGLKEILLEAQITDLYCVGLATEYCVLASVIDALESGFKTFVILEGVKGVNLHDGDSDNALEEMAENGAILLSISDLENG